MISLQTSCYSWEENCKIDKDRALERRYDLTLGNFKNVMLSVINKENERLMLSALKNENECPAMPSSNQMNAFRSLTKRKHSLTTRGTSPQPSKRTRTMDTRTSTPLSYRQCPNLSLEDSTSGSDCNNSGSQVDVSDERLWVSKGFRTDLEGGVNRVKMTPKKSESLMESIVKDSTAGIEQLQASDNLRERTCSLPT